jgi:hypothetical protein
MPIDFLDGVTIDIKKIPDYHEIINAAFKEKIDKQICEIILHSENPLITNEMKEEFKNKVVDNLDEKGILEHRYYQQNGLGFLLVKNDTSLTSQHSDKYIAFTLYKYMKWMNFDMKTGGLSIICETMKPFKKKLPIINLMRNNFDEFVETISKYYQKEGILDRRCVKKLIYGFLNYQNFQFSYWKNYLRDRNISIKNSKKLYPLLTAYIKEIKLVRKLIYENNIQLAAYLQDKKTFEKFGIYSSKEMDIKDAVNIIWCETIETEIVYHMYNFLSKEKFFKNNFCTMFGDSIMFPYVECDQHAIVKKFQKYVKTQTGFDFNCCFKSLKEEELVLEEIIEERKQYENDYVEDEKEDENEEDDDEEHDKAVNPWNDMDAIYKHPIGKGTIFVGNEIAAENLTLLKELKITRVINCTLDNLDVPNFHEKYLKYYNFAIKNWHKYITSANSRILEFIYPVFRFINTAIENGESVLVHCHSGAHRSGALGIASLMYYENLDVATAISKMKTLRPIVNPRGKLKEFLYKFEFDKNYKNGSMNYEYEDDDDDDDEEDEQEDGEYEDREDDEDDQE